MTLDEALELWVYSLESRSLSPYTMRRYTRTWTQFTAFLTLRDVTTIIRDLKATGRITWATGGDAAP